MKLRFKSGVAMAAAVLCLNGCGSAGLNADPQNTAETSVWETLEAASNKIEVAAGISDVETVEVGLEQAPDTENTQNGVTAAAAEETVTEPETPQTLHFVDAWGEWHDTVINPEVEKHDYDWTCLSWQDGSPVYEGDGRYTIRKGVDVSHYQGEVDWEKVKAAGIDFVILRLGYRGYGQAGNLKVDKRFHENIKGAQLCGLDVGVYLFSQAINEAEAVEEAEFVLEQLEDYELQLPVVFDPELIRDDTARTDNVTGEQFTLNTIAFCEKIKEAGFAPMIYSNMLWEAELFDLTRLAAYPIWYADYESVPQTPYHFRFWQYSEKGTVDGIKGLVDLNLEFVAVEQTGGTDEK